jgi:threonine/homoserine/homoserine lactone efflux protein
VHAALKVNNKDAEGVAVSNGDNVADGVLGLRGAPAVDAVFLAAIDVGLVVAGIDVALEEISDVAGVAYDGWLAFAMGRASWRAPCANVAYCQLKISR